MHAVEGLKVRTSVHGSRKVRNLRIAENVCSAVAYQYMLQTSLA